MKSVYLVFLSVLCLTTSSAQTEKKMNTAEKDSLGHIERFDFAYVERLEKETGDNNVECDGWYIQLHSADWPVIVEYAPADENVYFVLKNFYPNGMIHNRGKRLGIVKFGLWEHFNRHGKLVKVVDEDAKFGEVKWYDVVALLEKEGWFNRQTGEINIRDSWAQQGPITPNGEFTYKINRRIDFFFSPAEKKNGKEVKPPVWKVTIYENKITTETIYEINGHTGEYTKKVVVKMLIR